MIDVLFGCCQFLCKELHITYKKYLELVNFIGVRELNGTGVKEGTVLVLDAVGDVNLDSDLDDALTATRTFKTFIVHFSSIRFLLIIQVCKYLAMIGLSLKLVYFMTKSF